MFRSFKNARRAKSGFSIPGGADAPAGMYIPSRCKNLLYALTRRFTGTLPAVLNRAKVTLAVLAGIVLPLVALLCSIVILSDGKES